MTELVRCPGCGASHSSLKGKCEYCGATIAGGGLPIQPPGPVPQPIRIYDSPPPPQNTNIREGPVSDADAAREVEFRGYKMKQASNALIPGCIHLGVIGCIPFLIIAAVIIAIVMFFFSVIPK